MSLAVARAARAGSTLAAILVVCSPVAADPASEPQPAVVAVAPARPSRARHDFYLEVLGKGGIWGAGYAYRLRPHLAIGAVGTYLETDGQRQLSLAPYLEVAPLARGPHAWFVDVGADLVHLSTPSPVPEWSGTADTGIGAELATGYEYRRGILLRAFAMVVAGKGGVAPWLGVDLGWTL